MGTYFAGQTVVLTVTFINTATGAPIAPSTVELRVLNPSMTEFDTTTAGFTNPSTGVYTLNVPVFVAGTWVYRWLATGTFNAASEGSFQVSPSPFLVPP
jgi:hypothetical protein